MKKLAFICAGLLLFLSTSVFAEEHADAALESANEAVAHGKAGHTLMLVERAKESLEYVLSASLVAKGVLKNHLDTAAKELQESIDHGNLGHVGRATIHAEVAVRHIKAGNK